LGNSVPIRLNRPSGGRPISAISKPADIVSRIFSQRGRDLRLEYELPGSASVIGAVVLLAVTWGVSVFTATHRDTWSSDAA